VTGSASNLGRAIALAFAAEGARLVLVDLDVGHANGVATLARSLGSPDVHVARADVTAPDDVRETYASTHDRHGSVDVLVNGVGWGEARLFAETTPDDWQRLVELNLFSALHCTRAALTYMIPQRRGSIVNLSSDASRQGEPREAVYGAAKAAINSFGKSIAKENGRFGIRCNTVCSGLTLPGTDDEVGDLSMWREGFSPAQLEAAVRSYPLCKLGRPQDVASAVLFLASDAASHITGQVLSVSGGYSMVG
jgi:2-hydroxycyclohexanecarboxyl-CoA dehydrogenase